MLLNPQFFKCPEVKNYTQHKSPTVYEEISFSHRFDQHVNGTTLLPADLRSICYKSAMKLGDEKTFNNFVEMYTTSELNEEKDRIAQALGSSKNINILRKVIDFALSVSVLNGGALKKVVNFYSVSRRKFEIRIQYMFWSP